MTEPSAPQSPKARRQPGREPQTIDLSATIIDEKASSVENEKPQEIPSKSGASKPDATKPAGSTPPEASKTASSNKASKSPELKNKSSRTGMILAGLAFGLIGGIAGTVLMQNFAPNSTPAPISAQFDSRFAKLEAELKAVQTKAPASNDASMSKISGLETAQQDLKKALQGLTSQIDALSKQVVAAKSDGGAAPQELAQRLDDLEQRLTKTTGDFQTALAKTRDLIAQGQNAFTPLATRLDALEQQTTTLAKQTIDPLPAVRFALISRLQQAIASGKPFADTLNAVRKTGITETALKDIAGFAASGAPTAAQLKAEFREPAEAMVAYERQASGESLTDRLLRMSERVIRVRPLDNPEATDLASVTVRIEKALERNAFTEAAGLWNGLPDAARQLSAAWGQRVNERAKAAVALSQLEEQAVLSLEGSVK